MLSRLQVSSDIAYLHLVRQIFCILLWHALLWLWAVHKVQWSYVSIPWRSWVGHFCVFKNVLDMSSRWTVQVDPSRVLLVWSDKVCLCLSPDWQTPYWFRVLLLFLLRVQRVCWLSLQNILAVIRWIWPWYEAQIFALKHLWAADMLVWFVLWLFRIWLLEVCQW